MEDDGKYAIQKEPFIFRDSLCEGIKYSRAQSDYRFSLLKCLRFFLKKPLLLLLSKCFIGFLFILLPIICIILLTIYSSFNLLPLILSQSIAMTLILILLIHRIYDDKKHRMNISPYWTRKSYYDMFHFLLINSFILWLIVSLYQLVNFLNDSHMENYAYVEGDDNTNDLKGCVIIKILLILKYHNTDRQEVGRFTCGNDDQLCLYFFKGLNHKVKLVGMPIVILTFLLFAKTVLIKVKYTMNSLGIIGCVIFTSVLFYLDKDPMMISNWDSEKMYDYLYLVSVVFGLLLSMLLVFRIYYNGIKKKDFYNYGEKKVDSTVTFAMQFLYGFFMCGILCISVTLGCLSFSDINAEYSFFKIETAFYLILAGICALSYGLIFLYGHFILGIFFKPIEKEYGRKMLSKRFYIHYTPKSKRKTIRSALRQKRVYVD